MSIKNQEVAFSISTETRKLKERFVGIRELGFNAQSTFVVDAWTTPKPDPRGGYLTTVPISPWWYREKNPTAAGFSTSRGKLTLYTDYGWAFHIFAPTRIINELVGECVAQKLRKVE